jgi:hypothetical protein
MFVYQSRFLRRGEVWFDNQPEPTAAVDWVLYRNRSTAMPGAKCRDFYNRLIDLTRYPEELLADMEPKTVAKIKTAEQEKLTCVWSAISEPHQLDDLESLWNSSIEAKKRWGMLDRLWLAGIINRSALELAAARDHSGALLVYTAFFRDKQRVQQLMNVAAGRSPLTPDARAKTNRASCFLLWNTLLRLKEQGIRYFDFGGWYPGTDDIQLLGANSYKKGFGGRVVREFECRQVLTLKGWLLLSTARFLSRARQFHPRGFTLGRRRTHDAIASQPLSPPV